MAAFYSSNPRLAAIINLSSFFLSLGDEDLPPIAWESQLDFHVIHHFRAHFLVHKLCNLDFKMHNHQSKVKDPAFEPRIAAIKG